MAVAAATRPPASTFAELLRRSRFASFDPLIAQTYTAPQAHARRGDYGLKRSIPMPYKDSYVSLAAFEHHAHFTEWNHAAHQVKFVKCVEEMNVHPRYVPSASEFTWERGLGEARTQWLIDSEFCEHTYPDSNSAHEANAEPETTETDIHAYGKQGRGAYGVRRPPAKGAYHAGNHALPNIAAMSPKQFQRYLARLRQLRPQFQAYVAEQQRLHAWTQHQRELQAQRENAPAGTEATDDGRIGDITSDLPEAQRDDHSLFIASQGVHHKLHRQFLSAHAAQTYAPSDSMRIEKQPHQNGALLYSHPSGLDSLLSTSPQPGIVLQNVPRYGNGRFNDTAQHDYVAIMGGVTATLKHGNAGAKVPLYHPDQDNAISVAENGSMENSIASMRMVGLKVRTPPNVVSRVGARMASKQMMQSMTVLADAATDLPWSQRNVTNPYRPGSYEYVTATTNKQSRYLMAQRKLTPPGSSSLSGFQRLQKKNAENHARQALRPTESGDGREPELGTSVLKSVLSIVGSSGKVQRVRDEDL